MRFRTQVFLFSFLPVAILLGFSFGIVQSLVQLTVREGVRSSLRDSQLAIARVRAESELQNSRFLSIVGENSALKAGIQLLLGARESDAARNTVEDQLNELCAHMNFDLLLVSAPNGTPLAGVVRQGKELIPFSTTDFGATQHGLFASNGHLFQTASVPIDQADENIGLLTVGEQFGLSELTTSAVLIRKGKVLQTSIPGVRPLDVEEALARCDAQTECTIHLRGENYVTLPMQSEALRGSEYEIRSVQNVDAATTPVLTAIRRLFVGVSFCALIIALACSIATSQTVVSPITTMIARLRDAQQTGVLPKFGKSGQRIREINELAESFDRASASIQAARDSLQTAYLQFVESLANALDARDPYTAGHSWRVSQLSCSTAEALNLDPEQVERIRVGALLHDIGKIGIADRVLQKPAPLSDEEFALVQEHPQIGRRILEAVRGFSPFLAAVELHHENWNGTGYPLGQCGEQTPIDARIIHVTDAYDAMTSDRPYRNGMTHEQAIGILKANAGSQFDPKVVAAFSSNLPKRRLMAVETEEHAGMVAA